MGGGGQKMKSNCAKYLLRIQQVLHRPWKVVIPSTNQARYGEHLMIGNRNLVGRGTELPI